MVNLEILVDGKAFDYQDREDFGLLFRKTVNSSLTSRSDTVSFTTNFPATQNNLSILGLNFNLDNYQKFYKDAPFRVEILVNSVSLVTGILIVQKYSKEVIQGLIIGDGISQASLIQNKSIQDLNLETMPFLGGIDILESQNEQTTNPDTHRLNNNFVQPLLSYGTYFVPNRMAKGHFIDATNYTTLVETDETVGRNEIPAFTFEDMPPSVYYVNVFKQIFADIGYNVQGSQINSDEVKELIIPCLGRDEIIYNWNTIGGFELSVNQTFANTFPVNSRTGAGYTLNDVVVSLPINCTYRTIQQQGNPLTPTPPFEDFIHLNNNYGLTHTYPFLTGNPNNQIEPYQVCPTDGTYRQTIDLFRYQQIVSGSPRAVPSLAFVRFNESDPQQSVDMMYGTLYTNAFPLIVNNAPCRILPDNGVDDTGLANGFNLKQMYPNSSTDNFIFIYHLVEVSIVGGLSTIQPMFSGEFRANKGDRFKLIMFSEQVTGSPDFHSITWFPNSFSVECIDADIYPDGYDGVELNPAINLPDISQTDFVKDAITRYNLYFVVNEQDRTIMFESWNDFYVGNPYKLQGKFIEASQKEVPERQDFKFKYDSQDFLTATNTDQNFTKRSEMRYVGDIEEVTTIQSKTEMQAYTPINKYPIPPATILTLADFQSNDITMWRQKGNPILIPQISDKEHYNSVQSDLIVGNDLIQPFETQDFNYAPRLLRLTTPYEINDTKPNHHGIPIRYQYQNNPVVSPPQRYLKFDYSTRAGNSQIVGAPYPKITAATNTNLDQTYLYNTYYDGLITEYQATEIVTFSVYIDYLDFVQLKTNRLIDIDGIPYRIVDFQPYNPISPKPIKITLQKVL